MTRRNPSATSRCAAYSRSEHACCTHGRCGCRCRHAGLAEADRRHIEALTKRAGRLSKRINALVEEANGGSSLLKKQGAPAPSARRVEGDVAA